MKISKIYLFFFVFLLFQSGFSQSRRTDKEVEKENRVTKEVDNVNNDIKETNSAVKGTVSDSKETIKDLKETFGSIFGSGGGKSKSIVSIQIPSIDYDNESLNAMYGHLQKVKGVKKPTKQFKGGSVSIQASYKNGADNLWQSIPADARKGFKLVEITDNTILLQLKQVADKK